MENETPYQNKQESPQESDNVAYEVALGLCIGDSLGATSEFQIPYEVGTYCIDLYKQYNWPERLAGGGKAHWKRGEPTDDSGNTTRMSLLLAQRKGEWYAGGEEVWMKNKEGIANGSLMRNGVIGGIYHKKEEEVTALDATITQGIITHFHPICVLCCVLQTLLIRDAILNNPKKPPTIEDLRALLQGPWLQYQQKTTDEGVKMWLQKIGSTELKRAENRLLSELEGFEKFNPYKHDYRGNSGSVILTFKICLWGLYWGFSDTHPSIPDWLPDWIFKRHGFDVLMWIVCIGADADTYGASAGPLLAAYFKKIPENFKEGLMLTPLLKQYLITKNLC